MHDQISQQLYMEMKRQRSMPALSSKRQELASTAMLCLQEIEAVANYVYATAAADGW